MHKSSLSLRDSIELLEALDADLSLNPQNYFLRPPITDGRTMKPSIGEPQGDSSIIPKKLEDHKLRKKDTEQRLKEVQVHLETAENVILEVSRYFLQVDHWNSETQKLFERTFELLDRYFDFPRANSVTFGSYFKGSITDRYELAMNLTKVYLQNPVSRNRRVDEGLINLVTNFEIQFSNSRIDGFEFFNFIRKQFLPAWEKTATERKIVFPPRVANRIWRALSIFNYYPEKELVRLQFSEKFFDRASDDVKVSYLEFAELMLLFREHSKMDAHSLRIFAKYFLNRNYLLDYLNVGIQKMNGVDVKISKNSGGSEKFPSFDESNINANIRTAYKIASYLHSNDPSMAKKIEEWVATHWPKAIDDKRFIRLFRRNFSYRKYVLGLEIDPTTKQILDQIEKNHIPYFKVKVGMIQSRIGSFLQEIGLKFQMESIIPDLGISVDFLIGDKLILEVDGPQHLEANIKGETKFKERDPLLPEILGAMGYRIVRLDLTRNFVRNVNTFRSWIYPHLLDEIAPTNGDKTIHPETVLAP
jgi:very-short-patch-repair endonuclease